MKVEGWLFLGCAAFFGGADVVYWYYSKDPTGTAALAFAVGLAILVGFYVLFTGRRLPERPEDNPQGEIVEGTGEVGFKIGGPQVAPVEDGGRNRILHAWPDAGGGWGGVQAR